MPSCAACSPGRLPPGGILLTGAPRGEPSSGPLYGDLELVGGDRRTGQILGTADKFHLVPLGEYVPIAWDTSLHQQDDAGLDEFHAGPGPRTLHMPGLPPFSPLICYEVIFPRAVVDPERPARAAS